MDSFSSTSLITRLVRLAISSSSEDSNTLFRCSTTNTGMGYSLPNAVSTARTTCRLPADPAISNNLSCFIHLSPYFFPAHLPVSVRNRRETQRLFAPQGQVAEVFQAVVKKLEDFRLQLPLKIDQHIPAQDQLEFIERKIRDQVMRREDHLPRQRRIKLGQMGICRIIDRKILNAARLDIVLRIFLHLGNG